MMLSFSYILNEIMSRLYIAVATAVAGFAVYCNLPATWLLPAEKATLEYLSGAKLQKLDGSKQTFSSSELWKDNGAVIMVVRRPGCFFCREEAAKISTLHPELKDMGIPLYAVVHEELGVKKFQPYFKGEVFLDINRIFYGPKERRTLLLGLLRISVWQNAYRTWKNGYKGNLKGDGSLLGGVFVLGKGNQGILYEYREKEFGDQANITEILSAAKEIA
ncbi:redox-regulatory protein FAM213A-like isoform X2 [Centruroides sculpturatus]|uniref:redox-regulatory protein FAM213A-like isoform X2 n=1 Tax=Centruroides sculpturatus TaxID=218467 RepID=UPI000C6E0A33|nr:redox-regulatory protein FAM213A-like isoform X2 [Centruroides sculpturatus]